MKHGSCQIHSEESHGRSQDEDCETRSAEGMRGGSPRKTDQAGICPANTKERRYGQEC